MTEVLLDVTNSEIDSVIEETLRKTLNKGRTKSSSWSQNNFELPKWLIGVHAPQKLKINFSNSKVPVLCSG